MNLKQTVSAIKRLEIQGAAHIAEAGLRALSDVAHKSKAPTPKRFLLDLHEAKHELWEARATEPYLRNMTELVLANVSEDSLKQSKADIHHHVQSYLKQMKQWKDTVAQIGATKVPKGGNVFMHCHSSMVMAIMKEAAKTKKFTVLNTEARPFYQGRISATEISKMGIPVKHYVDSAVRLALKEADVMFIGCDAITPKSIVNKIGSELFAETAERYGVPVYVATPALKFDPETVHGGIEPIEQRPTKEVWDKPTKGVTIINPAFERVDPKLVDGIISELGIYSHKIFLSEVQHHYPEVFRN